MFRPLARRRGNEARNTSSAFAQFTSVIFVDIVELQRDKQEWHGWYKTARWQAKREAQLRVEPLCRMYRAAGRLTSATICDYIERHGGDPVRFWTGPFQSLCMPCHSSEKQREENSL